MPDPILICGAGPTGLVLAIWLTKRKIPIRIIDKAEKPGTASRALVVHARTLEFYRQMGIDKVILAHSVAFDEVHLWVDQKQVGTVQIGGAAADLSYYPYVRIIPQDEHEALLEQELARLGVQVERNTELLAFDQDSSGVKATLKHTGVAGPTTETIIASFLAGCDGARSTVRESIGADFQGGTYDDTYYVADITGAGPIFNNGLNLALDEADFLAVFPLKEAGRARLIGTVPAEKTNKEFDWSDVGKDIITRLKIDVRTVNWFSTYRVHHRVATFFRKEKVFLLGDAGHVHSPVGGQGMNTGIGDAVNLSWKLAEVLLKKAPDKLLDTYEEERIAFAKTLVATTDRAFTFINKKGLLAKEVRTKIAPIIFPGLFHSAAVRRYAFRLVSQIRINYRKSTLSEGPEGGDRLPWKGEEKDNYAPLSSLSWQVHSYGTISQPLIDWCKQNDLPLHRYTAKKDALYLVRPDGYIGWSGDIGDLRALIDYAARWRVI